MERYSIGQIIQAETGREAIKRHWPPIGYSHQIVSIEARPLPKTFWQWLLRRPRNWAVVADFEMKPMSAPVTRPARAESIT